MPHHPWVALVLVSVWLLWMKDEDFSHPNHETGQWEQHTVAWHAIGAFLTEARCRDHLREAIAEAVNQRPAPRDAKMLYKTDGDAISWLFYPKDGSPSDTARRSQIFRYYCLPERIDPRRPP